ncbi:acetyl-CoA carboxylase biotin carboxylase subunit [Cytobacillus gottheilii]|uniref:acetyl-CoA carboxylase biotin carboxylase subunit n=1 Tax=Cytobacillus gottheilii TaxID=859144 RepID=UPI0009BA4A62|nr:acetyl-CoA carboxylase biotin carboxylase subunit [Cytobacillus gottheilii]
MQKIVIANRGEIALRIMRTCHKLGIETIAVYSDADQYLPYVQYATKAVRIGEPPVSKSYLNAEAIINIAKTERADAIHPGYGFLSENADFARAVIKEGLIFIGPDPETIELMGDKIHSRSAMKQAGVPVVPGSDQVASLEDACSIAAEIGYPVMLKASGGGGGIGMVKCENEQALVKSFQTVKTRAKAYFGSETIFLEKFIENARHIEIQVFGDYAGSQVHLFERDCSIQRRNQKVIEEAPAPALSLDTKNKMYEMALKAAAAVHYKNAGTIEFIVDEDEHFYFLEMNTRLQVEHPVTEGITGLDLVEWQLLIASGQNLPLQQPEIFSAGHSIEFRLYAEDPVTFLPSPGKIEELHWPDFEGVRVDYGYAAQSTVTPFYDPMIAKCIISGSSREQVIEKAIRFFNELKISGIKTNAPLFTRILQEEDYQNGSYSTAYLNTIKM